MRFTLESPTRTIVLKADAEPMRIGWFIAEDGIHGWFGSPEPREDAAKRYTTDGDRWPTSITQGARTVTLDCVARFESTVECARARDDINDMFGRRVRITGHDASGPRSIDGFLADDPDPELTPDELNMIFTLTFTCPYPIKSGPETIYPVENGYATVYNEGNAPAWPKLIVAGKVTEASMSYGGHTVRWKGSTTDLTIDNYDLAQSVVGVDLADAFSVPPGTSRIAVTTAGGTPSVALSSAWR